MVSPAAATAFAVPVAVPPRVTAWLARRGPFGGGGRGGSGATSHHHSRTAAAAAQPRPGSRPNVGAWAGVPPLLRPSSVPDGGTTTRVVGMSDGNGHSGGGGGGSGGGGAVASTSSPSPGGVAAATTTAAPSVAIRLPVPQGDTVAQVPDDGLTFIERVAAYADAGRISPSAATILIGWHSSYAAAAALSPPVSELFGSPRAFTDHAFSTLLELVRSQTASPAAFEPHHVAVRSPFDYYAFGLQFCVAMVNLQASRVLGAPVLAQAMRHLAAGHNVIFLANHQSEADPHAIALVLSNVAAQVEGAADLGARMLFMAGDRVREDSVAAPFSLGFNMLTVYSKKHIRDVPDQVDDKVRHNRVTAGVTASLFKDGGSAVWFAPSGGRDRRCSASGRVEVAPFDPAAVEMMRLTAAKSGTPSHFFPMALTTYAILPPPQTVDVGVGEARVVDYTGVGLAIGDEIDWEAVEATMTAEQLSDKKEGRRLRAAAVQEAVEAAYTQLGGYEQ